MFLCLKQLVVARLFVLYNLNEWEWCIKWLIKIWIKCQFIQSKVDQGGPFYVCIHGFYFLFLPKDFYSLIVSFSYSFPVFLYAHIHFNQFAPLPSACSFYFLLTYSSVPHQPILLFLINSFCLYPFGFFSLSCSLVALAFSLAWAAIYFPPMDLDLSFPCIRTRSILNSAIKIWKCYSFS